MFGSRISRHLAKCAVVFTVDEHGIDRRLDVAKGPCVPAARGLAAIAHPSSQNYAETADFTAALYTALTGLPCDDVLTSVSRAGLARLCRFADVFVSALSEADTRLRELIRIDDEHGEQEDSPRFMAARSAYRDAWLAAAPSSNAAAILESRLSAATEAAQTGQPLFVWYGRSTQEYRVRASS
jgi:hypothetical protein